MTDSIPQLKSVKKSSKETQAETTEKSKDNDKKIPKTKKGKFIKWFKQLNSSGKITVVFGGFAFIIFFLLIVSSLVRKIELQPKEFNPQVFPTQTPSFGTPTPARDLTEAEKLLKFIENPGLGIQDLQPPILDEKIFL